MESDQLIENLKISLREIGLEKFQIQDLQSERSCEFLTKLANLLFKTPAKVVQQLFKDLDIAKDLQILLGKVFKEVLKIGDDFLSQVEVKVQQSDQNELGANLMRKVTYNCLQFISIFGHLLDYLVYDSYKLENALETFSKSKSLMKLVLSLMLEAQKIQTIQRQLLYLFPSSKRSQSRDDDSRIILNYAKVLFNLIINPNNIFKQQFVEEQGIYIIKKILKKSYMESELEIYFYCLGIIPPIIITYPSQAQQFLDNAYMDLLQEQLIGFYEDTQYLHIASPLLLAIKALVSKSNQLKEEFMKSTQSLEVIFEIAADSYGQPSLKNIYISSVILLCECGFEAFAQSVVPVKIQALQQRYGQDSGEAGADIKLKEQMNRLNEKIEKFKVYQRDYNVHDQALKNLRNNIFDDDQLEKALQDLNKIWTKSLITRSFFITNYGNLDQLMQCLKNLDESVMLNSCKCLITILSKEEGAQDLFLRHRGIQILKNCLQDYNIDIKKCSLSIMCNLVLLKEEVKFEIFDNGVIELCIHNIDKYPEDDIDAETLCLSLNLVSQVVLKQPKIQEHIIAKSGLNKIVMQLKILLDQFQRKQEQNIKVQLEIFDKICLAIINIVYGNKQTQDLLRSELQIFNPLINFLTKSVENLGQSPIYNQDSIYNILNLLVNAIDTNKTTQEYLIKTFKCYDIMKALLTQNSSLRINGLSALLLSHLVWTNVDGQAIFSTREILKRLIFLMDFNQLINEGEAEAPIESLMEVSFYALLSLINLSHENLICQQLVNKMGGLSVILKQLKSPSFDPKKTACFCLGNLIQNNQENVNELLKLDGVSVLVNLINDEEDDDLSNKSYQCLEYMGSQAVIELAKQTKTIVEKREKMWRYGNCIMLDVFNNRERHVFLKALTESETLPSLREFGPQDQDDIIDLKSLEKLEKILPVLNGLVYLKSENREALQKDVGLLKNLFDIFKYQLPIEIHENALYALLNIIIESPKQLKEQMINSGFFTSLICFIEDLHQLEFQILRSAQKFIICDYGIKVNYQEEEALQKEEKTIEEIQPTVFEAKLYEYYNTTEKMFYIDLSKNDGSKRLVEGRQFQGLGLKKSEVIKHLEDLRALGYSIINNVVIGNAKLAFNLVKLIFKNLPRLVMKDVMILPNVLEKAQQTNTSIEVLDYSENLWDESLDLLLNLINIKQVYEVFREVGGMDIEYLENLRTQCEQYQLESNQSAQQKSKTIIGKITQVINDIKQIN
ncbi:UNKNOWN [Stylonychia lemnae]|uniref:Armadillo-type fold n=1 Tax=Stylonychia lemnae TaxID=5949 RepID=A0A078AMI1_STYLE|nr:UNKNOWN [Stylonychia lemnae]|eukprot:CDW82063.1 UNKNOWN [Stylonychia lemnae]